MSVKPYLPSAQFALLTLSLFLSTGLVYAAQYLTAPSNNTLTTAPTPANSESNWAASLSALQASEGSSLPTPPDENQVAALRQDVQSDNLTDSVARTLLLNVTDAGAQGLGDDSPTQNKLLKVAYSQITQKTPIGKVYTIADLIIGATSKETEHTYGNALIQILKKHPKASMADTFSILADQINGQKNRLSSLAPIGDDYAALAFDLAHIPVPQSLLANHLALVNDYSQIAASFEGMAALGDDPLRAMSALQTFSAKSDEVGTVFINIARVLDKDGILFTSGEPGASWVSLLSGQ